MTPDNGTVAKFFHGGVAGLNVGDLLVPSPPAVKDGCPVCVARSQGRTLTVGEYRRWAAKFGVEGRRVIAALEGAPDDAPVDAPSGERAVYFTPNKLYATWYAARSNNGDLYRVTPVGEIGRSAEDNFETYTAATARIVEVVRRRVVLDRTERRLLERAWRKADRRAMSRTEDQSNG